MKKMINISHGHESNTLCTVDATIEECGSHGKME